MNESDGRAVRRQVRNCFQSPVGLLFSCDGRRGEEQRGGKQGRNNSCVQHHCDRAHQHHRLREADAAPPPPPPPLLAGFRSPPPTTGQFTRTGRYLTTNCDSADKIQAGTSAPPLTKLPGHSGTKLEHQPQVHHRIHDCFPRDSSFLSSVTTVRLIRLDESARLAKRFD